MAGLGGVLQGMAIGGKPAFTFCLGTPGILLGLIGILGLCGHFFRSNADYGERIIIVLKKDELQKQGFYTFWDTTSFRRLRRS
jgi:hypothetical protein